MEFAEYRQPWETGPHWELKREFLEFYKDNFPEERLLCLAQAYSNIELLHCSYPTQVMLQIHELSKPLKGCQRFRGNGSAPSSNSQQGKRKNNESAISQKFKFIKFCSENKDSSKKEVIESKCEPPSPNSDSINYESIINSQNFNIFKKLSEEVKKILELSKENPYEIIVSAAMHSNIEDLIDLKFTNQTIQSSSFSPDRFCCEFFVGETKIAAAIGDNRYAAKSKASENALFILTHFKEPPSKSFEDVHTVQQTDRCRAAAPVCGAIKTPVQSPNVGSSPSDSNATSDSNNSEKELLVKLAHQLNMKNIDIFPMNIIHNAASQLRILDDVVFKISQDRSAPRHQTLYLCDLFIRNTLIGQGEGPKMKMAKLEAFKDGANYLKKLRCSNPAGSSGGNEKKSKKLGEIKKLAGNSSGKPVDRNECVHNIIEEPIRLNKELLNNSFKMQLLLIDKTEENDAPEHPAATLSNSAQMCRKGFSYNFVTNDDGTIRAEVLLDYQIFGTGSGQSRHLAKIEAAKCALERLQKQVYTVKVKKGTEDGFQVNRNDMLNLKCDAPGAVSEDNIGCRMLRMMGWSGGGIGKKQGISEPIRAGSNNFKTGLGYADLSGNMDMKNLKSKMETLLREYSKSDATMPLIFSLDFTKNERKEIHKIAQKFDLFNHSYGKGEARQLFIKRKVTVGELLDSIVKAGGRNKKYELVDMSK